MMKLDIKTIRSLEDASDERLYRTLKMLVSAMGMEFPDRRRPKLHCDAIRRTLSDITEADVWRINELMENYKRYKNSTRGGYMG